MSLIHLNLILIASSAVGWPGRAVSLAGELAFFQKHFADRECRLKYGLHTPHGCMGWAALHFNRALVYSCGYTQGENHTVVQSCPALKIKTAPLTETQDLPDKLEVMGLTKAGSCVTLIAKTQNKY